MNPQIKKLTAGLYFVATPIGTARDITLRALDILASADVLAAEDTRSLRHLMEIHGVDLGGRQIISYHDHNGDQARPKLLTALADGKSVAYASEAGTPLIADPGFDLSRAAAEAGYYVTHAPGPSAVVSALVLAGLPTDRFLFSGFLPNAQAARKQALADVSQIPATLVFYESPKRVADMLHDAASVLGDRRAVVCREITKKFEEVSRGTLVSLAEEFSQRVVKGEIVVLIDREDLRKINENDVESALREAMQSHRIKDAAEIVSKSYGLPRRDVYQLALRMGKMDEN